MNQQEATDFVIRELGKHHQKNDIIQNLCETTSMNWEEAKRFIQQVEARHGSQIARKQSPIILIMGIGIIFAGIVVFIRMFILTFFYGIVYFSFLFPVPYSGNFINFVIGLAMIAGGAKGIWNTITQIWNG